MSGARRNCGRALSSCGNHGGVTAMGGETAQLKQALVEKETELEAERVDWQQTAWRAENAEEELSSLGRSWGLHVPH